MVYGGAINTREHMPKPLPNPLPDAMPLRDALRGLRHAVRRGGETLLDVMPVDQLPRPAAELAGMVLREVGDFAKGVNEVASGIARFALGANESPHGLPAQPLKLRDGAEDAFAQGVYAALRLVLRRLNAPSVYISETAARLAYLGLTDDQRRGSDAAVAAALSLALAQAKVMRGTSAQDAAHVPGNSLEHTAIFAVMLWMQSNRSEADDEAALGSATGLAVAVATEADAAFVAQDSSRLAALYAEFAAHV
jgi:hypothetical protein